MGGRSDYIEENRDQVTRYGRAVAKAKAWAWAPANLEKALDNAIKQAPDTGSREEVQSFVQILQLDRESHLRMRTSPPGRSGSRVGTTSRRSCWPGAPVVPTIP